MKLTVVRHTSVDVPKGICYGITDVAVASSFGDEADRVRKKLKNEMFDAVFSSPLKRCTQLAGKLAGKLCVTPDDRITELDFGDWEMTTWDAIFESSVGKAWFADYVHAVCPKGESFAYQMRRISSFLTFLKEQPFHHVLVVSHAGVLRALMCLLQDKTPDEAFRTPIEYGQVVQFNLDSEWKINL